MFSKKYDHYFRPYLLETTDRDICVGLVTVWGEMLSNGTLPTSAATLLHHTDSGIRLYALSVHERFKTNWEKLRSQIKPKINLHEEAKFLQSEMSHSLINTVLGWVTDRMVAKLWHIQETGIMWIAKELGDMLFRRDLARRFIIIGVLIKLENQFVSHSMAFYRNGSETYFYDPNQGVARLEISTMDDINYPEESLSMWINGLLTEFNNYYFINRAGKRELLSIVAMPYR
ncbi:hypothetical protein ACGVWS_10755 [Enterobacteriaceae bacterium LUAb1]